MGDPIARAFVHVMNPTAASYAVTDTVEDISAVIAKAIEGENPWLTLTAVTGYHPPQVLLVNAFYISSVAEMHEGAWEINRAASVRHYERQEKEVLGEDRAGFG